MKVTKSILKEVYTPRDTDSKKGDYGKLLIIGGNEKYSGAPALNALAAMAAYRTGTDIVEVAAPGRAAGIIATFSPNIITIPLKGSNIATKHLKTLLKESENKTAFVIGGGLGKEKATQKTIKKFLKKIEIPGVIDADAIHTLKKSKINLRDFILTPHAKEFYLFTGQHPSKNIKERSLEVQEAAKKFQTTILLKGHVDVISNGAQTATNSTGNPYMTKGGTGDTLAGICGSLLAQGINPFKAACAAAYINGKAAELSRKTISLTASDILLRIEEVVESI